MIILFFVSLVSSCQGFGFCLMVSRLFGFVCFTSSVSLTGFYMEDEPLSVLSLHKEINKTHALLILIKHFFNEETENSPNKLIHQM